MRLGVCCSFGRAETVRRAGFDYVEWNLGALADLDEKEFEACAVSLEESGLRAEAVNCFFGAGWHLTGPEADFGRIEEYARFALGRAAELGTKIAVLGGGGARKAPEGYDRYAAGAQFVRVMRILGDAAAEHGITIALEPLNRGETDLVNDLKTGEIFLRAAEHPNVKLLVDFFHLWKVGEDPEDVSRAAPDLVHAHIARPNADRRVPGEEDVPDMLPWAEQLRRAEYAGRLSLEGAMPDFERDILAARAALRVFQEG